MSMTQFDAKGVQKTHQVLHNSSGKKTEFAARDKLAMMNKLSSKGVASAGRSEKEEKRQRPVFQVGEKRQNEALQEKFHRVMSKGARNISETLCNSDSDTNKID